MPKKIKNLPETIKLGFHEYSITYEDEGFELDGTNVLGIILDDSKNIAISLSSNGIPLRKPQIAQTIMHELIHAIDYATFNIFKDNEDAVDAFSEYLCMLIRDNPDFIKLFKN